MSEIVLIDTSIYLNILDVAGYNQSRSAILSEFELRIRRKDHFLLPMATIWETGNHIADLPDGRVRRIFAQKLVQQIGMAIEGEAPYRPTYFPERHEFLEWIKEFPDYAGRSKSKKKTREGVSLADMSIIKEWERSKSIFSMSIVTIWSLDSDLAAYRYEPST